MGLANELSFADPYLKNYQEVSTSDQNEMQIKCMTLQCVGKQKQLRDRSSEFSITCWKEFWQCGIDREIGTGALGQTQSTECYAKLGRKPRPMLSH